MDLLTLKEVLDHSIQNFGTRPCSSIFEGEELTYNDFWGRIQEVRELLLNAGVGAGDKVALLSSNMPNWGVSYFAATSSAMVIVPILPDFSGEEVQRFIVHSEAKALIVSDKLFQKLDPEFLKTLNIVIRSKNLGVLSQTVTERAEPGIPQPQDLASIIYTSGTTSEPKGVMLSHYNLCKQIELLVPVKHVVKEDVYLAILPLSHVYECSLELLFGIRQGASIVYLDKPPTAASLMPALKAVRPTIMLSVPLIIEKIYKSQVVKKFSKYKVTKAMYAFPPVRKLVHRIAGKKLYKSFGGRILFFGIGGAKLEASTERFLREGKFPYAIGYGLTETAPLIAGIDAGLGKFQSTGPVMPGVEIRLENITADGLGEIVVNSPCTMMGYYKNPEATAAAFTPDGWFRTKDLGALDKDGFLYIKGRLGSMIVGPSGENIYPEEIENVINGHFLVTDSIVKEEKGKLVAMVQFDREELERKYQSLKEGLSYKMEEIKSELIHYVNSKVGKFSHISMVEEKSEGFEKTPTNKIKRFLYTKK